MTLSKFKAPKVHLQSWVTLEEYTALEKLCLAKQWTISQLVREGVALAAKEYAEEKEAA
jgi:hypothetical protein